MLGLCRLITETMCLAQIQKTSYRASKKFDFALLAGEMKWTVGKGDWLWR